MTQAELAKRVGVARQTVVYWENDTQVPAGDNLLSLASALHTTPLYILHGVEEETPEQAVAQSELDIGLSVVDRVVRLAGGKEGLTDEDRRELQKVILNAYIDEWQERGRDPSPLLLRLARVDRGEF